MRACSLKYCLALLSLWVLCGLVSAKTDVTITPSKTYQTIDGIGGSVVYYLDWLTTHKNKEEIYDTLANGLGITAFRIANWAQEANADLTYDSEIVKEVKRRRGNDCFLAMSSWTAPASLKANNSLSCLSSNNQKGTLKKENGKYVYDDFGAWWKRSLLQYQAVGIYPDYVSIQNEIDCETDYESMVLKPEETSEYAAYPPALVAVSKAIKGMNKQPKLLGPEVLGIGWNNVQKYVNKIDKSLIYGYNFHYYHSGLKTHEARELRYCYPEDFLAAMTQLSTDYLGDKPMYMDENSTLRDHEDMDAIYTATFLAYAFSVNHVSAYLHWNLIWGDTGDGLINLEFSEKGYTTDAGYTISGDYHAVRHFSKFIERGWLNIDAQTSDPDSLIVCAFKSSKEDAYTVVLVNRHSQSQTVTMDLEPSGMEATVIMSRPLKDYMSKTIGTYKSLPSVNCPPYSILTIAWRKKASTYVYDNRNQQKIWTDTTGWNPKGVPEANDTVIVRRGISIVDGINHTAPVTLEKNGVLRLVNESSIKDLTLKGGNLRVKDGAVVLNANITVETASIISVAGRYGALTMDGKLYGNEDLTKEGDSELTANIDGTKWTGYWTVNGGTLTINNEDAIGTMGVYVDAGTLEVDVVSETQMVAVKDSAKLVLNKNLIVENATLGSRTLAPGEYTSAEYPEFISGEGKLIVDRDLPEIVKHGAGGSKQELLCNSSLTYFYYDWFNAETVSVTWNPHLPEGVEVKVNNDEHKVSFSGTCTEIGIFWFTITSVSGSDAEAKKTGSIRVNPIDTVDSSTVETRSEIAFAELSSQTISAYVADNQLHLSVNSDKMDDCHVMIVDMRGVKCNDFSKPLLRGENIIQHTVNLNVGTYLLQIRTSEGVRSMKLVVE